MLYVWLDLGFHLKYREMFKFLKNTKKTKQKQTLNDCAIYLPFKYSVLIEMANCNLRTWSGKCQIGFKTAMVNQICFVVSATNSIEL